MADFWNVDWLTASPMFAPLRAAGMRLPAVGWPNVAVLDAMAEESGRRIVNASGERIRFVEQCAKPGRFEEKFEPSTFLRGEVGFLIERDSFGGHPHYPRRGYTPAPR